MRKRRPSKLWKQIDDLTEMLVNMPLSELQALREGDPARAERFNGLNSLRILSPLTVTVLRCSTSDPHFPLSANCSESSI
jgi:hypothetical protein